MIYSGLIYRVDGENLFAIRMNRRLVYFYMQRHAEKKFGKYLSKGLYVSVEVENKIIYDSKECLVVNYFIELSYRKYNRVFYSIDLFRDGIKDLLANIEYSVFLDFEFNMHEFFPVKNFISEIIEAGYCVCDKDLNVIEERSMMLIPTKYKKVTKRTIKFLKYNAHQVKSRLPYIEFYNTFKNIVEKYDPHFIVWGRNDINFLKESFTLNNVKPIHFKFIDLSQLHVNYYNLKNTPGLFKIAEEYNNIELPKQKHNALEDALMTKLVFSNFKETIK